MYKNRRMTPQFARCAKHLAALFISIGRRATSDWHSHFFKTKGKPSSLLQTRFFIWFYLVFFDGFFFSFFWFVLFLYIFAVMHNAQKKVWSLTDIAWTMQTPSATIIPAKTLVARSVTNFDHDKIWRKTARKMATKRIRHRPQWTTGKRNHWFIEFCFIHATTTKHVDITHWYLFPMKFCTKK